MNEEVALGADLMHVMGDERDDVEFHAAGAVMHLLNGSVLHPWQHKYLMEWLGNVSERI